jgi:hypothetical protein
MNAEGSQEDQALAPGAATFEVPNFFKLDFTISAEIIYYSSASTYIQNRGVTDHIMSLWATSRRSSVTR